MKNSRRIGAAFERSIAIDLRKWLPDHIITRNRPDNQCGQDGVNAGEFSIVPDVKLAIECKRSTAFDERQLFKRPITGPLERFWQQACAQAECLAPDIYRHPMLIVRRPRGVTLVFLREATSRALTVCGGPDAPSDVMEVQVATTTLEWETLRVWRFEDLLLVDSLALSAL